MDSLLLGSSAKPCSISPLARAITSRCTAVKLSGRQHGVATQLCFTDTHVRTIEKRSVLFSRCNRKQLIVASAGRSLESGPESYSSKNIWDSLRNMLDAFYRFSRPHTVIGTALSIVSVSLLAVERSSDFSPIFFIGMFEAIAAALMMNIYIVGLNQLSDIEIDKVNKPYLPLASGEYSVGTGIFIVTSFAVLYGILELMNLVKPLSMAFLLHKLVVDLLSSGRAVDLINTVSGSRNPKSFWVSSIVGSWPLFWALFISFVLGTAYSIDLPMFRWKRFALVAAMCILAVRAVIVQIAFFLHMQTHVFARPAFFSRPVIFATAFMSFFSVVIALFKDIPDIEGDRIFGIRSFTVRLGQKPVFWTCISLLQMAYAVAIAVGISSNVLWSKALTVGGHVALAAILWSRAKSTDLSSKDAITSFYMFIWKLFYAEYFLIPLVR